MATMTNDRQRGFTLIELLVGLALLGLAATLLLQGVAAAGLIVVRERGRDARLDDVAAAQRVLRGAIERLRPVTRRDSATPVVDLRGEERTLSFVAPPGPRSAPGALLRYGLRQSDDGDLILDTAQATAGSGFGGRLPAGSQRVPLLNRIAALRIDYFGAMPGGGKAWQARWWDRGTAPALIRVRVAFPAGDARRWPDLIAFPRANAAAGCADDITLRDCSGAV